MPSMRAVTHSFLPKPVLLLLRHRLQLNFTYGGSCSGKTVAMDIAQRLWRQRPDFLDTYTAATRGTGNTQPVKK